MELIVFATTELIGFTLFKEFLSFEIAIIFLVISFDCLLITFSPFWVFCFSPEINLKNFILVVVLVYQIFFSFLLTQCLPVVWLLLNL